MNYFYILFRCLFQDAVEGWEGGVHHFCKQPRPFENKNGEDEVDSSHSEDETKEVGEDAEGDSLCFCVYRCARAYLKRTNRFRR